MLKAKIFNEELTRVAFGGVTVMNEAQADADRFVDIAFDAGINYFDVAPTYGDAEIKLGNAWRGRRDDIFLACKTEARTKEGAQKLLDQSLLNLKTDHFDLYQFHAVFNMDDVNTIMGPNGAMETYLRAKEKGIIKNIGFSAHSTEAALAMMEKFDFDSILFPFNFGSMLKIGYGQHVLQTAKNKDMAILGIKSMALTEHMPIDDIDHPKAWYHPIEDKELARKAVAYTLSQGVDVILPPGDIDNFQRAVAILNGDITLSDQDLIDLKVVANEQVPLFPIKRR